MGPIGKVISTHRMNATLSILVMILGTLFAGVSVLLFVVKGHARPEAQALIGNITIASAVLGILVIALGVYLRTRAIFVLGENGVHVRRPGRERDYLYRDIVETCQMYRHGISVGIMFHVSDQEKWEGASAQLSGYYKFRDYLYRQFLETRVPILKEKLKHGQSIDFRKLNARGKLQSAFVYDVAGLLNAATDKVTLTKDTVTFDDLTINIAEIQKIDQSGWTDNITFTMRGGESASLKYTSLFDGELMLLLINYLRPTQ